VYGDCTPRGQRGADKLAQKGMIDGIGGGVNGHTTSAPAMAAQQNDVRDNREQEDRIGRDGQEE